METLVIILCMLASILLMLVVLVQPGKADMISGMGGFGGQFTNLLGVRQSRNILQNMTMGLAAFLMVASIVVNKFMLPTGEDGQRAPITTGAEAPMVTPGAPAPQQAPAAAPQQAPAAAPQTPPAQQGK